MESTLSSLPIYGWIGIIIISLLIFTILMFRGVKLGWGDKSIIIGKKLENKIDTFKKEIEIENIKKGHDETVQKMLFKKSMMLDNYLVASLIKSVKKLDADIYNIFNPYVQCQFPSLAIIDIFEDVLMERVNFNNIKEKLQNEEREAYLDTIVEDIKNNYILFYVHLKALHCGENYPEWNKIEDDIKKLVRQWLVKVAGAYIENVSKKIEMYKKHARKFETESFKKIAINFPLKKNKKYLETLNLAISKLS